MRRLILAAVGAIVLGGAFVILIGRGGSDHDPTVANTTGLEARTVSVGEIDARIEPRQLDDQGAVFAVGLDTHSVDLSADLTEATLEVAGTTWPVGGWSGDGPGGHHRDGELSFEPAGPATGTARLTLAEFAEPVDVSWELEG